MKILLVNPSQAAVYGQMSAPDYPPLSLAYVGAVLEKNGHDVQIIDIDADGVTDAKFTEKIKKGYKIVGLTSTTPTYKNAERLCKIVKKNTDATTVVGGIHPTIAADECLQSENIDYLVRGEGEKTVLELVKTIEDGTEVGGIAGISYRKDGKIIHNPKRELIENLDELPYPARHLFNQRKYTYPDSLMSPVMPIISSRGCPHGCTYCCTKLIFTRNVRFRSAENVVGEIEDLIKTYGVKEIHIWDDNYTLNKKRVLEITELIKKRGIKLKFAFPNGLRVDQVDEEILKSLKDMGTYSVAFGVESGNQKILDRVEKGTNLAQIRAAFKLAKKVGLETWGFFMLGLPGEDRNTMRDTIEFAKELDPDVAKFHLLQPFPGTEAFEQLKKEGLITNYDYSQYGIHTRPVHRLPGISEDELLAIQKNAYRQFFLRPSKIIKHIIRMKSANRIKLNLGAGISIIKSII